MVLDILDRAAISNTLLTGHLLLSIMMCSLRERHRDVIVIIY